MPRPQSEYTITKSSIDGLVLSKCTTINPTKLKEGYGFGLKFVKDGIWYDFLLRCKTQDNLYTDLTDALESKDSSAKVVKHLNALFDWALECNHVIQYFVIDSATGEVFVNRELMLDEEESFKVTERMVQARVEYLNSKSNGTYEFSTTAEAAKAKKTVVAQGVV